MGWETQPIRLRDWETQPIRLRDWRPNPYDYITDFERQSSLGTGICAHWCQFKDKSPTHCRDGSPCPAKSGIVQLLCYSLGI